MLRVLDGIHHKSEPDAHCGKPERGAQEIQPVSFFIYVEAEAHPTPEPTEKSDEPKKNWWQLVPEWLAIAAFLVSAVNVFIACQAILVSIHSSQVTERAYLSIGDVTGVGEDWQLVEIPINNSGRIQADASARFSARLIPLSSTFAPDFTHSRVVHEDSEPILTRVRPGLNSADMIIAINAGGALLPADVDRVARGLAAIDLIIVVDYGDGFGHDETVTTQVCLNRHFSRTWGQGCSGYGHAVDLIRWHQ